MLLRASFDSNFPFTVKGRGTEPPAACRYLGIKEKTAPEASGEVRIDFHPKKVSVVLPRGRMTKE